MSGFPFSPVCPIDKDNTDSETNLQHKINVTVFKENCGRERETEKQKWRKNSDSPRLIWLYSVSHLIICFILPFI